ncbi:MAG: N-acetyl-gamma-glutamyl-phosphate reductase [Ignavibacteriae bacterium HGW-Ignavibacteriae-3]|nr:MAG: N-acetyl-gamma-glutamyl-phosphate reductase [Ignavibacteriae bacterium HGW-Ignavibacteriae-3]
MINVGIVGAAGYSGAELIKLLLNHPEAEILKLFGHSSAGNRIEDVYISLRGMISLEIEAFDETALSGIDLLFVALPSGSSMKVIEKACAAGVKVIDLGGDFRLNDKVVFSKYYKHEHTAPELLNEAVYGLSEWNENKIASAQLIANPGCYPTSILLALIPLLKNNLLKDELISIVSYSGTSGAGKSSSSNMMFSEVNESVRAYKVGEHQHIPEIKQYLKLFTGVEHKFSFVPHLLPVTRGIYSTIHVNLKGGVTEESISETFKSYYEDAPFMRMTYPSIPEMKDVLHTNFCDIGFKLYENNSLVLFSTIDNLVKGAAGQAIQNMNIMFGLAQTEGLLNCSKKKKLQTI